MHIWILCFAAGAALLQLQAVLPEAQAAWFAPPVLLLLCACLQPRRVGARLLRQLMCAALCFGCGFLWAAWLAGQRLADELPLAAEGVDIRVIGVVAQLPQPYERSLRFEFDVERVLTPQATVPARIALAWWGTPTGDGRAGSIPELHPGERWQLTVRLRRPHGLLNPNGFDYEAWLLERNLRATGYVRAPSTAKRLKALVMQPGYVLERLREAVRTRIVDALPQAPYTGVLVALAIGDQRGIPASQWQVYTRTGINHLISISGLHVTMISGLIFWLVHWGWSRSARLLARLPARKAAAAAGLLAALGYAWLAGFAIPAQRTVYMLAVVAFALWRSRLISPWAVLCAALLPVVVLDPWAALSPGFWLSFGAVAIILLVSCHRIGEPHWLESWGRVQWAVTIGLTPLLIAMFQQISLISPLANALAIPLVSLVVVPLILLGVVIPGTFLLQLAHALMAACGAALEWMSALPAAVWQQHAPPLWTVGVALAGTVWLLLPRGFPARWIGVYALLPMFLILPERLPEGVLRLAVLDVGQGLGVVAQTRNHALLYDTGTLYGPQSDSGSRVIVPYLRAGGIRNLDAMIVSHGDKDHSGGAASVLQAVPVARVLSSLPEAAVASAGWPGAARCLAGERWRWDGIDFEILHPSPAQYARAKQRSNDRSCVLRISAGVNSVLLTADIERRSESELLQTAADKLPARVLLVPHHGSRTSSSPEFLARVAPEVALIAAGYRNRFGHPKEDVVARYRALGSRIYRTDLDGALMVTMDASGALKIQRQRLIAKRYWHSAPDNPDLVDDDEETIFGS